jgi:hypothetical protein
VVSSHHHKSFDWLALGAKPHVHGKVSEDLFAKACALLNQIITLE